MVEKYCYNIFLMTFFGGGRECEGKRRQKNDEIWIWIFPKLPFGTCIKKICTLTFWSFLLTHIRFTPCEGPEGFVYWFVKKLDHEIRPSSMVRLHGPWCKPALIIWTYIVLWYFILDMIFYQQRSNWLFGHYRELTSSPSKNLQLQWNVIAMHHSE